MRYSYVSGPLLVFAYATNAIRPTKI